MKEKIAQSIGRVLNGFQIEIGFISLDIGISVILSYWFKNDFRWATVIPYSTFLLGATAYHIKEMIEKTTSIPAILL